MKFLPIAVVASTALVSSMVTAVSNEVLKARMESGKVNYRKLMSAAKPYDNDQTRKLEDITASSTIKFSGCKTMSFDGADAMNQMNEDLAELAQYGGVIPVKSYAMFDIYSSGDDSPVTYLIDLPTYVQAAAEYIPEYQESYCDACGDYQGYCAAHEYNSYQDTAAAKVPNYISCYKCNKMGCFRDNNGSYMRADDGSWTYNANIDSDSLEWLSEVGGCRQADNADVFIGMQCSNDGQGLALGVYFDQYCTLYANQLNAGQFIGKNNYASHSLSAMQDFASSGSMCTDPEYMVYEMPDNNGGNYQGNDNAQVSELCSSLLYGGGGDFAAAVRMDECGNSGGNNQMQYNNYGMPYDLSADDIGDSYSVCSAVLRTQNDQYGWNGGWNAGYAGYDPNMIARKNGTGRKALILWLLALVAVAGVIFSVWMKKRNAAIGDKNSPLINEEEEAQKTIGTIA
jgi:hypothetical protein